MNLRSNMEKKNFGRNHFGFSNIIRNFLQKEYEKQPYPSSEMIQIFANKCNLTSKQVTNWFYVRRSKLGHSRHNKI